MKNQKKGRKKLSREIDAAGASILIKDTAAKIRPKDNFQGRVLMGVVEIHTTVSLFWAHLVTFLSAAVVVAVGYAFQFNTFNILGSVLCLILMRAGMTHLELTKLRENFWKKVGKPD